jgi:hypothetical protein
MAKFTFFELHVDDASFSADRPFSSITDTDDEESIPDEVSTPDDEFTESDEQAVAIGESDDDGQGGSGVPTRGLATLGAALALVGIAAAVKRLAGGDDPDVEIETPEDDDRPVGVTVDE